LRPAGILPAVGNKGKMPSPHRKSSSGKNLMEIAFRRQGETAENAGEAVRAQAS
jgi:hypothetical protein